AHFLGAPDHHRKTPEQDEGHNDADCEAYRIGRGKKLLHRADLPNARREQYVSEHQSAGNPGTRKEQGCPVDAARSPAAHALEIDPVFTLPVIIGRLELRW